MMMHVEATPPQRDPRQNRSDFPTSADVRVISSQAEFVSGLSEPGVAMVALPRPNTSELERIAQLLRASTEEIQFRGSYTRETLLTEGEAYLETRRSLEADDRRYLMGELVRAFDLYYAITGERTPQVVLSKVDAAWLAKEAGNAVAQVFHYEAGVPLNLVCTLVGRGTEYVTDGNVRRDILYQAAQRRQQVTDAELLRRPEERFLMPTGAIVIFKGELHGFPGERGSSPFLRRFNMNAGLVHRGVALEPGEARLRLNVYSRKLPTWMQSGAR